VGGPHVEVMSVRDKRRDGVVVIGRGPHDHGSVACGDSLEKINESHPLASQYNKVIFSFMFLCDVGDI
jgi:hypothetical protein